MSARGATGVTLGLLAGGRASRLGGIDKAWLWRGGEPQVLRWKRRFEREVDAVLVGTRGDAARFAAHGMLAVTDRDRFVGSGPLAGLEALACACTTAWLLTMPVDLVEVDECLLQRLHAAAGESGAFAVDDDGPQPLVALWPAHALRDAATEALEAGDLAVHALQARMGLAAVRFTGVRFGNLNTPADLVATGAFGFPTGIAFDEALAIIARVAASAAMAAEEVPLARAHGRILAGDVVAPIALPPFDNSAMDGFALRSADLSAGDESTLRIAGEQFAGPALALAVGRGECVRITTGAPLPEGADAIAIRERVHESDGRIVVQAGATRAGLHVRRAGEDVRAGDVVLQAGTVLTPARVSLAAALGIDRLRVAARPTVAVFTSGDELVEPGLPLQPGEIHDSNRELLMGLLCAEGLEPVAWPRLPDEPGRVASVLRDAAANFDLVLTCGAVSAGDRDHIPAFARAEGEPHFWKVRMRPGMPVLFAALGRAQLLALPGNPVSVLATWLTLGRALLDGMQGRTEPRPAWFARLAAPFDKRHPRREFLRGRLQPRPDATVEVLPNPADGSHRLAAAAGADALIVLPEGERHWQAGEIVRVMPLG